MRKIVPVVKLAAQFATIKRVVGYRAGHLENDSEHSYQLALASWSANHQYKLKLKDKRLLKLTLVHDLVEIYAGDTDAHGDKEKIAAKKENERKAFERLKKEYSPFSEILNAIEEYEKKETLESQLVYVLDKLLPSINVNNDNGDYYRKRRISMDEWKSWLFAKINYASLNSKLKRIVDESIEELETNHRSIFFNPTEK